MDKKKFYHNSGERKKHDHTTNLISLFFKEVLKKMDILSVNDMDLKLFNDSPLSEIQQEINTLIINYTDQFRQILDNSNADIDKEKLITAFNKFMNEQAKIFFESLSFFELMISSSHQSSHDAQSFLNEKLNDYYLLLQEFNFNKYLAQ